LRGACRLWRGVRVQGSGFRVQGSGFRVQGSGFRVRGLGLGDLRWRLECAIDAVALVRVQIFPRPL